MNNARGKLNRMSIFPVVVETQDNTQTNVVRFANFPPEGLLYLLYCAKISMIDQVIGREQTNENHAPAGSLLRSLLVLDAARGIYIGAAQSNERFLRR
jgi:hypothetical protein